MNDFPKPSEVLSAMITPAVLISATGTLVLSTSNRLSRVIDRVRGLTREAEDLQNASVQVREGKRELISDQLVRLSERLLVLRTAMTTLYAAIGLLVMTSIAIGIVALFQWRYGWIPVLLGLAGACALLYGSLLLVREAQLATNAILSELVYTRQVINTPGDLHPATEDK
ncbi:MAG: DUF2721 domain-containing protein [Chloroflexi bacterium]|nr:DUF2721 domain-containing protein [Chloroflexota bacterium]